MKEIFDLKKIKVGDSINKDFIYLGKCPHIDKNICELCERTFNHRGCDTFYNNYWYAAIGLKCLCLVFFEVDKKNVHLNKTTSTLLKDIVSIKDELTRDIMKNILKGKLK